MTFTPQAGYSSAHQGSSPYQIHNWQEAELNAARWMRHWGFHDAEVTPTGPDGGIDVRSTGALAQVKYLAAAVGRPDIQRFIGAAAAEGGKRLIFFSGSDYTATAVEFAEGTGLALFQYALDGSVVPVNAAARLVARAPAAAAPSSQMVKTAVPGDRDWKERLKNGGWYFAVTLLSVGYLTAIPFWHARVKLRRPELQRTALAYTVADIVMFALMGMAPKDTQGNVSGGLGNALVAVVAIIGVICMVSGSMKLRGLRKEVYSAAPEGNAAVARVLEQRARREEARKLLTQDPSMARELGIGRPDLERGYDDGGLVDLNTAPASVIADVSGVAPALAEEIVEARHQRGDSYFNVGELFVDLDLPLDVQETLRERAVF